VSAAPSDQRHQPEETVLYRTIATQLPTLLARTAGEDGTGGWPGFVRREFEAYLRCGHLDHPGLATVANPIRVAGEPPVPPRRAPEVGQHTDEVLRAAGYDDAAIERLRQLGVIA
jgi:hypothetical protein